MNLNHNVFGKITERTRIYRIFPRNYFFQLFEDRQNALILPTKWKDPFENVILRAEVRTKAGKKGRFDFHDDVYGQCWTLERASDAMWQIYSRDQDAIRVRTTVGKLIKSLRTANGNWADTTCFIGRVKYLKESELREFGKTVFETGLSADDVAKSLTVKRKAYKHENEVRLIYIEPTKAKHNDGVCKYDLDPLALIDQVMVDGRVLYEDYKPLKAEIMKRTGLRDWQIKRSLLYRQPEDFVVQIP